MKATLWQTPKPFTTRYDVQVAVQERGIPAIASFDADFDQVTWLQRLARPEEMTP
jgi:hypothetical protein